MDGISNRTTKRALARMYVLQECVFQECCGCLCANPSVGRKKHWVDVERWTQAILVFRKNQHVCTSSKPQSTTPSAHTGVTPSPAGVTISPQISDKAPSTLPGNTQAAIFHGALPTPLQLPASCSTYGSCHRLTSS